MRDLDGNPGDSLEKLLKRFRRELSESGLLRDYRRHQRFSSKSELKRERMRKSLRRLRRRQSRGQERERRER